MRVFICLFSICFSTAAAAEVKRVQPITPNKDVSMSTRVCEKRPSHLLGVAGTAVGAAGASAVAGAGAAGNAAGIYALTHATTGAAMLGSTAGGVSAAGTVGIMGGTAGAGAAALAVVLNPLVWIPAAVTAVTLVGVEGGCYVRDKVVPTK